MYSSEIYFPLHALQPSEVLFEVQFVSLHKNDSDIVSNLSPAAKEDKNSANCIREAAHVENIKDAHEHLKESKRIWKSVHFEKIKGTDAHNVLKESDRIRKTNHLTIIKGTHAHEQLKAADRARKKIYNIKDTDIHTCRTEIDRKRKLENFNRLKGSPQHEDIKKAKRMRQRQFHRVTVKNIFNSIERIDRFQSKIKQGPYYVCVCCERGHYKNSTILYKPEKYQIKVDDYTILKASYDSLHYICKTCSSKLKKGSIPCQAVWNKLEVDPLPPIITSLHKLEKAMISKRLLFSKVLIMPKGQMPKIKGAICNVPIDVSEVNIILPRAADSNGLISVKLKRKLVYRGHVLFEPVRPGHVQHALEFLKNTNPLYSDIVIALDQIPYRICYSC